MTLFLENVRLALFSLKANKMRALLTMLGIIIGISSVIAIMTVGNSLTVYMGNEMSSMGTNNVEVYLTRKKAEKKTYENGLRFDEEQERRYLRDDDYISREMIENYVENYKDSIKAVGISQSVGDEWELEYAKDSETSYTAKVYLSGVTLGQMVCNNVELIAGRFFTEAENQNLNKVAIISGKIVNVMFDGDAESAIGSVMELDGLKFTVVGVYKYEEAFSMASMYGGSSTTNMYIPYRTAADLNHDDNIYFFNVMVNTGVDPKEFADLSEQYFKPYYRNNDNFEIEAFTSATYAEMLSSMMGTLTTAIAAIASIALLVGGIGVMNIMLVSITERTREIGIRKSLGAPNSSIRMQFIVEAVVICLIGGLIGMLLGIGGGSLIAKLLLKSPGSPSVGSIIGSLCFSMAIGVFFGFYPANKAAKMDPIEALRHE